LPRIRRLRDIPGELGPFAFQALAKALGFRDAGKLQEAREWAAELVRLLKSHDLLT
jgi:hypothetical protein